MSETLPQEQQVYWVKATAFLRAVITLNNLRDLLEENRFRLTDGRHMSDIVPFIYSQEQGRVKELARIYRQLTVLLAKSLENAICHFLAYFSAILRVIHTQVIPNST